MRHSVLPEWLPRIVEGPEVPPRAPSPRGFVRQVPHLLHQHCRDPSSVRCAGGEDAFRAGEVELSEQREFPPAETMMVSPVAGRDGRAGPVSGGYRGRRHQGGALSRMRSVNPVAGFWSSVETRW